MSPNLTTHRQRGSAKTVVEALRRFRRVLITAHIRPDGDAVGSSVAMARLLKANGWEPTVALSPLGMGPPKFLLDYAACVAPTNVKARDYDCALLLDCGGPDRLPDPLRDAVSKLPTCVIDHHATSKPYGIARWIVPDASSTGELVHRFATRWKWEIDLPTAEALWVALVTDTGRFAYSCTHPSTLRAAADLLARPPLPLRQRRRRPPQAQGLRLPHHLVPRPRRPHLPHRTRLPPRRRRQERDRGRHRHPPLHPHRPGLPLLLRDQGQARRHPPQRPHPQRDRRLQRRHHRRPLRRRRPPPRRRLRPPLQAQGRRRDRQGLPRHPLRRGAPPDPRPLTPTPTPFPGPPGIFCARARLPSRQPPKRPHTKP